MGLTKNDGFKRPSYYAYRTLSAQLGDYTLIQHVFGSTHPATGIQGFMFKSKVGKKMVIWNIDGKAKSMVFPDKNNSVTAVDALNRPIRIATKSHGLRELKVSGMPIYISGSILKKPSKIKFPDGTL